MTRSYRDQRGARDNRDGTVTFVLYAPDCGLVRIRSVRVESGQLPGGGCPLTATDSGHWFAVAPHFKNVRRVEYLYQVEVEIAGEGIYEFGVSDPYSRQVDINFTSAVSIGERPIPWVPFVRPPLSDLTFYELHVYNFTANDPALDPRCGAPLPADRKASLHSEPGL